MVLRDGASPLALAEVRRHLRRHLRIERAGAEQFEALLREVYEAGSGAAMDAMGGLEEDTDLSHLAQDIPEVSDLLESEDEAPVIRLINALLTQAVKENGSDIHIEPFENRLVIRFRVDGVLREVLQTKRAVAPLIVSRIKVMSRLDIAEKRLPQDGRISLRIAGRAVDVRVSTIPAGHGERVVLRLLDKQAGRLDLDSLGMDGATQRHIDELIHKPNGILLVTGPTGSGKTTTLYAALDRINDRTRNIMTVEDPIEYYIDGIGQTQVNTRVEMTFARGLRAILRQDPDVVMVGEIRDLETAQIAVQATLDRPPGAVDAAYQHCGRRGHAAARHGHRAVPAVLEPGRRAGAAAGARAQPRDAARRTPPASTSGGCSTCRRTRPRRLCTAPVRAMRQAIKGRTGIYELVLIDEHMRTMIHDGASEQELERYARTRTPGIRDDGRAKVLVGGDHDRGSPQGHPRRLRNRVHFAPRIAAAA